jgi:hypothetical protein
MANLRAYCSCHRDELLIEWRTFNGVNVETRRTGNWVRDYLDRAPDASLDGLGSFVAEPADGDHPHFRYHLRCPKPGCSYHQELTTPIMWLHNYVRAMWGAQIEQVDIWDLERWVREQSGRTKQR